MPLLCPDFSLLPVPAKPGLGAPPCQGDSSASPFDMLLLFLLAKPRAELQESHTVSPWKAAYRFLFVQSEYCETLRPAGYLRRQIAAFLQDCFDNKLYFAL